LKGKSKALLTLRWKIKDHHDDEINSNDTNTQFQLPHTHLLLLFLLIIQSCS
jgi:hypothetical protein